MKKHLFISTIFFLAGWQSVFSQSLSINTDGSSADASAILDVKSTVKGLLIPRMTTVQKNAIATPATGLQVYDTDLNQLYFYNGSTWTALTTGSNYWTLSGGNIYNNSGNKVGIGTTNPSAKLHIGAGTRFTVLDTGSIFLQSGNTIGSARDWKIYSSLPIGYLSFRDMGFDNLNNGMTSDAMVIQYNTGNVGIGAAIPGDKLEINGNLRFSGLDTIYPSPSTTGSGKSLWIKAGDPYVPAGGSGGSININATNNMPAGGSGYGNLGPSGDINITSGTGYNSAGGNVNIAAGQSSYWGTVNDSHSDVIIKGGYNITATDAGIITAEGGHIISFNSTTSNGGNVILKSGLAAGGGTNGNIQLLNGNVGIGTSAPSSKLEVCGNVRVIGTIVASGSITTSAISCPSDFRYKTNITSISYPLQKLMMLNGVNYFWKTKEYPEMNFTDKIQIGFIAQDLEKIFPEMVFTDDKGYKSIDYSRLTPVLVETIKEQQKQITDMNARLQEIEKMLFK